MKMFLLVGIVGLNLLVASNAVAGGTGRLAIGAGKQAVLDVLAKRNFNGMFGLDEYGSIEFTRVQTHSGNPVSITIDAVATEGFEGHSGPRITCHLTADIEYSNSGNSAKAVNFQPADPSKICLSE